MCRGGEIMTRKVKCVNVVKTSFFLFFLFGFIYFFFSVCVQEVRALFHIRNTFKHEDVFTQGL